MADHTLDAKGLNCPLPILKARKALKEVPSGGTLEILEYRDGFVVRVQLRRVNRPAVREEGT